MLGQLNLAPRLVRHWGIPDRQKPGPATRTRRQHRVLCAHDQDGSALFLVPAAVLVLAVLGAIALDAGAAFLGQAELAQDAQTAAEDATGQVATSDFYQTGTLSLDPTQATQVADAAVAAQHLSGVTLNGPIRVQVQGAQVCVSLSGEVPVIFGAGLPGVPKSIAVSAHSTATAAGYLGPTVPASALC